MSTDRQQRQCRLLTQACAQLEELLLGGTTTASSASQRSLHALFEQAGQVGLLRLASSLRLVLEELKRLDGDPDRYSPARLCFFIDRSWLLARGILAAIEEQDQAQLARLSSASPPVPLDEVVVATCGVQRRHVPGAFSAFEFRLRLLQPLNLADGRELAVATPLLWSFVVPAVKGHGFPAEAFLGMRQKQGFSPNQLLTAQPIRIGRCALVEGQPQRLQLAPDCRIEILEQPSPDWRALLQWDPAGWLQRLREHRPDPLELPIELNQDVLLEDWAIGPFGPSTMPGRDRSERCAQLSAAGCQWQLRIDMGQSHLEQALHKGQQLSPQPALYGNVHVEFGQAVLIPLSLLGEQPEFITIGNPDFDRAALVRLINRA